MPITPTPIAVSAVPDAAGNTVITLRYSNGVENRFTLSPEAWGGLCAVTIATFQHGAAYLSTAPAWLLTQGDFVPRDRRPA